MGAEQSCANDIEIGESLPTSSNIYKIWTTVAPARYEKNQDVTVFTKNFTENDTEETRKFYENGIKNLKLLRHPNILKFLTAVNANYETYLIVERVRPLDLCLNDDGGDRVFETDEILCGLQNIFDAVKFLHENANLSHNNVGPLAIFVRPDQSWTLGSFEFSLTGEGSSHWCQSEFVKSIKSIEFVPPEDQKVMAVKAPSHARDVYGLGKLVEFVLPHLESEIEGHQIREIKDFIEILCNTDSTKRPRLSEMDYFRIFRNALSDITFKLRNIPLMSKSEKEEFFHQLSAQLKNLPKPLVARKLTKLLLSRYVFIEKLAVSEFLTNFLTPKIAEEDDVDGILPPNLFKQFVIPELLKMFCVHEKLIRLHLLATFERYFSMFDRNRLQNSILPELLLGMKDVDESLVAASMQCLALLVPILGPSDVTGMVHAKYFSDGRPRDSANFVFQPVPDSPVKIVRNKEIYGKIVEECKSAEEIRSEPILNENTDWIDWDKEENEDKVEIETISSPNMNTNRNTLEIDTVSPNMDKIPVEIKLKDDDKPLGSEFDIHSMKICREETEIENIFDEMTPIVKKPLVSTVKTPSKFDVVQVEESATGWFDQDEED